MRELYRSIARARMQDAGMKRINKRHGLARRSLFSMFWRGVVGLEKAAPAKQRKPRHKMFHFHHRPRVTA